MNTLLKTAPVAIALLLACATASAASVSISTTPGTSFNTSALAGFATTGAGMNGMQVTACALLSCETLTWAGSGGTSGGVTGTGWSMTLTNDSFNTPFGLTGSSDFAITSFSMNGRPGGTIFDVIASTAFSPGSGLGRPFELSGTSPFATGTVISVDYTDQLSVGGVFYGDLFTVMNVSFGGARLTGSLQFFSDTDNSAFDSPITQVSAPATLALTGLGLIGIAATRRRALAQA